ncbi:2-aminoethylphosphonate--pyruvate transaminase [Vogesella indigofera]|uniref:2-aminoethylphosphonate--pyruvate transaminase n=1 Tax=Vogesella indigofera TaxID=45465 RepID=UPI00234F0088|nr:2-aminoethylphosphonate--pyruvate transaminase [Vogesella indigofera]MDC7700323.1 2-aminoethylphosphonate--pyruvate transaminase [Vogesella indigofera]
MREPILLTPGPLTTALATKAAMLTDWGSWDSRFNELTRSVCHDLLTIANGRHSHACIPLQGSGTYAVEAAIANLVPRTGKLLVLVNGAYGKRMAQIAQYLDRDYSVYETADDTPPSADTLAMLLQDDPTISHVGLIHCETSTGILNPLADIAAVVHATGRKLIVDAMSSFGALPIDVAALHIDALIASSNKCLEGVPGMGFVIANQDSLLASRGNSHSLALDLLAQYEYMQATGQWRFTPPTHVVAALRVALDQYLAEGGQSARLARYAANATLLQQRLGEAGLLLFLPTELQAPIILTFHAPAHLGYQFKAFYEAVREQGFVLYPGKLTSQETFRVGCIGAIDSAEIEQACHTITTTIRQLGWTQ